MDSGLGVKKTVGRGRSAVLARIGCSLALLGYVLWRIDLGDLWGVLARVSPVGVAAGALALLVSIATAGVSWYLVFPRHDRPVPLLEAVRHTIVGASLNALLPTSGVAGDVYRGWVCLRSGGSPALSAYVVVAARWCGLVALSCSLWVAYGSLACRADFATLPLTRLTLVLAVGLSVLTLIFSLLLLAPGTRPLRFLARRQVLGVALPEVSHLLGDLVRRPGHLLLTLLVGVGAVYLESLGIFLVARAAGATHHAILFLLVGPAVRMIHQVPGFFNAIGIQEAAVVAAGDTLGVRMDVSLAISLLLHGVRIGIAVLGLLWYAARGGPTSAAEKVPGMA